MTQQIYDVQYAFYNDQIIEDYLDALFTAPKPLQLFRNRFELQSTIDVDAVLNGKKDASEYEAMLIFLTTMMISFRLERNTKLQLNVLSVAKLMLPRIKYCR
ncbi:MAG: hypothetical protein MK096_10775 [Oleiphilaceae bacterium]|uniref:hypothetical protein n=1 Tax=Oleiphilus sp. HI0125 TaxID=1822266 RepID=UPI0007C34292|nr:hypothetical protein [Oleiphilus sp. HI0125]KZZ59064.1 hypothetical protein A3762_06050 [Oleiphilus sp. HI0125]MCH2159248.1 hypothetical protein [Oleiphilaceae bacterium]